MASKIAGNIIKSKSVQRGFAAAATAAAPQATGLQVTKLQSGAIVASLENHSPLSRVSVFVKGGSSANTFPGASSAFQAIVTDGFSTPNHTGLHLVRLQESTGISLQVQGDREVLAYHGAVSRDNVPHLLSILANITSNDQYRPYECPTQNVWPDSVDRGLHNHTRIKNMQAARSAEANALDLAFKAAFRSEPLGRSELIPDHAYSGILADTINDFVRSTHGSGGVVVVGTGIDHGLLAEGAATFGVDGGATANTASKYFGGDARVDAGGDTAHVVVAGEAEAFGAASHAAALVAAEMLTSASAKGFIEAYSSGGLLGVSFSAPASEAAGVTSALVAGLRKFSASAGDLAAAKAMVGAGLTEASGQAELALLGTQLLQTGEATDLAAAVAKVSAADVAKVVSKAFGGKLSIGAYGNIDNVPYSDSV